MASLIFLFFISGLLQVLLNFDKLNKCFMYFDLKNPLWPQLRVEFCFQFFVDAVMLRFVSRYSWVALRQVPLQDTVSLYFLVTWSMLVAGVYCGFWYILTSFKWSSCCKKGRVNAAVFALKSRFGLKCQSIPTNCQFSRSKSWKWTLMPQKVTKW